MDVDEALQLQGLVQDTLTRAVKGEDLEGSFTLLVATFGIRPGVFALACTAASVAANITNPEHTTGDPETWIMYPDFGPDAQSLRPVDIWSGRMIAAVGNHDREQTNALFDVEAAHGLAHVCKYTGSLVGYMADLWKTVKSDD